VPVELTCENAGRAVVAGRPDCQVRWGGFDTPWRRRSRLEVPLPAEWGSIAPGRTLGTTVEIDAPQVAGDDSVFAVLGYFEPAEGGERFRGSVYSDSRLLRVR
jgi:hypothetical protein